jgi:excisionase family DNA binding protein
MVLAETLPDMLTPAQAARVLGVTPERVRQLSDMGRIPVTRTALGRLYRRSDIEAELKKRSE